MGVAGACPRLPPSLIIHSFNWSQCGHHQNTKTTCLLCGDVVPGWFLDGSAKHTRATHVQKPYCMLCGDLVPGWFLHGSWMDPQWFRQQTQTMHVQKQHCLLCGDVVPGWFLDGSWMVPPTLSNHACTKITLLAMRRRPWWFLGDSWMVPRAHSGGTAHAS